MKVCNAIGERSLAGEVEDRLRSHCGLTDAKRVPDRGGACGAAAAIKLWGSSPSTSTSA